MKILIVDDELRIRELLIRMMAKYGECEAVESGQAALEAFKAAQMKGEPFDLITLDIAMPDVNGLDVLFQIREMEKIAGVPADRRVSIIMATGLTDKDTFITSIKGGCDDYISKPFDRDTIEKKLLSLGLLKPSEISSQQEKTGTAEGSGSAGEDKKAYGILETALSHEEIESRIETIELMLMQESVLGFDPSILSVLDEDEIGRDEIENLKSKMGGDVFIFLYNIANSAFHGSLRMGQVKHFYDIVNRIGTQHTKALIILFALQKMAKEDHESEIIFAKSFASSVVGRIMARGYGFRDDAARKVELACLLSNIGALMMMVCRNHHRTCGFALSDAFIEKNHIFLTERILRRFQLPEYLYEMIMTNCFILERMGICLPTLVKLAVAAVEWSFRNLDNRLVFRSPQTSLEDRFNPSLAAIIEEQFAAVGLKNYLIVLPAATQDSREMH